MPRLPTAASAGRAGDDVGVCVPDGADWTYHTERGTVV